MTLLLNLLSLTSIILSGVRTNYSSSSSGGRFSEVVTCYLNAFLRQDTWRMSWILLTSRKSNSYATSLTLLIEAGLHLHGTAPLHQGLFVGLQPQKYQIPNLKF
jgi:hypothetical protein